MSADPVTQQLAVINVKLDLLITQRDDHEARLRALEAVSERAEDRQRRDDRLTAVERFQWKQNGATSLLSALLSAGLVKFLG